jgi:hypothetical protein
MAATKRTPTLLQQEQTRAAIQTTQLVKRLQCYALGQPEPNAPDGSPPAEIDSGRLKAIEILLRKSLPDLAAVTVSGDPDNPIKTEEVGNGAAKVAAILDAIAGRTSRDPAAE